MCLVEMYFIQVEVLVCVGKDSEVQVVFIKFQIICDFFYVLKGNIGDVLVEEIMNSCWVELWGEGFCFL